MATQIINPNVLLRYSHTVLLKKKEIEISIESKIIYDEEKNIENVFDTYRKFYKDLRKREYCFL